MRGTCYNERNVHYLLYNVRCIMYITLYNELFSIHAMYIVYIVQCTYNVNVALYSVPFIMYTVVYNVQCTLYTI